MDNLSRKVPLGAPSKATFFTFVPVVRKLPVETFITDGEGSGPLTGNINKIFAVSDEETTGDKMSDREIFDAEKVFIKEGAGNTIQLGTKLQVKPSLDHVGLPQTTASPSVSAQAENKLQHVAAGTASVETAADKHRGLSRWLCHGTAGLDEKHKMKLNYKSLAAIPTNNLLLDQQAIDEQVERGENPNTGVSWGGGAADTHAEMCSPAQLRQQSEELYAVIDDILANSLPPSMESSRSSTPNPGLQNSSCPKSLGRETKYASLCSLHPSTRVERSLKDKMTKPGVIRPMSAIPMLTVEGKEELHPNPCRQVEAKETFTGNKEVETGKGFSKCQPLRVEERKPERRTLFSRCDLQITEPDDRPMKAASSSFRPTEGQMEAFHTHI